MEGANDEPRPDHGPQVSRDEVAGEQAGRPRENVGLWQNDTQNDTQGVLDLGRFWGALAYENQGVAEIVERVMGIEPTS